MEPLRLTHPHPGFRQGKRPADYWPTPYAATAPLFDDLHDILEPTRDTVLDPCAGDGAILRVAALRGFRCWAVEIREEERGSLELVAERVTIGSWLQLAALYRPRPVALITNPPFTIARAIVAVSLATRPLIAAFLLRMNTLGSSPWRAFWAEHPPTRIRPIRRPSFTGDGKTDAAEYAWFGWIAGEPPINLRPI